MVDVILSFDAEDFVTPEDDDGTKKLAEILTEHQIRGCFCLVGEKARGLRKRKRFDVIRALSRHEVDYHSNYHSLHPTIAEFCDKLNWDEGVLETVRRERKGIADIEEIFGSRPTANVPPGNSWAPQALYAQSLLGLPVFAGSILEGDGGSPLWYCNTLNIKYHLGMDGFVTENQGLRIDLLKDRFEELYRERMERGGHIVLFLHPCRLVTERFWDGVNFADGANPPREEWQPAPLRKQSESRRLFGEFEAFITWVKHRKVRFSTYRDLFTEYKERSFRWMEKPELLRIASLIGERLNYHQFRDDYLSAAEIFAAFSWAMDQYHREGRLPERVPVRKVLGPAEEVRCLGKELKLRFPVFLAMCSRMEETLAAKKTIPSISLPDGKKVSPTGVMEAMAESILLLGSKENEPRNIIIRRTGDYPEATGQDKDLNGFSYRETWRIYPPGFHGKNLLRLARLQTWTIKPAVRRRGIA